MSQSLSQSHAPSSPASDGNFHLHSVLLYVCRCSRGEVPRVHARTDGVRRYVSVDHATRAIVDKGDDRWLLAMVRDGCLFVDDGAAIWAAVGPKDFLGGSQHD